MGFDHEPPDPPSARSIAAPGLGLRVLGVSAPGSAHRARPSTLTARGAKVLSALALGLALCLSPSTQAADSLGALSQGDAAPATNGAAQELRIGVLAQRGQGVAQKRWGLTAEHLSRSLPGYHFSVTPLAYDEVMQAARLRRVDLLLVNPAVYVQAEVDVGAFRIATLKNRVGGARLRPLRRGRLHPHRAHRYQDPRRPARAASQRGSPQLPRRLPGGGPRVGDPGFRPGPRPGTSLPGDP